MGKMLTSFWRSRTLKNYKLLAFFVGSFLLLLFATNVKSYILVFLVSFVILFFNLNIDWTKLYLYFWLCQFLLRTTFENGFFLLLSYFIQMSLVLVTVIILVVNLKLIFGTIFVSSSCWSKKTFR